MEPTNLDPDVFTKHMQLTKKYHRDLYPAIQPGSNAVGKVVLITGASRGLGRGLAISWARAGASGIAICSRAASSLEPVTRDIESISPASRVLAMACDTTDGPSVADFFQAIRREFGKLDVVIANVGVTEEHAKIGSREHDPDIWWFTMGTNLRSAHLTAHHYIQAFYPDKPPSGTFIALASYAGTQVVSGLSSYGIAKQATNRLVEFLDVEYSELKAFALDPGIVMDVAIMPEFVPYALDTTDLVGAFSIWLASGRADALKGSFLHTTWDIEELEAHAKEIRDKRLLKSDFLGGILGSGSYLDHDLK